MTELLVRPFKPNEQTQRILKDLPKHQPIPLEELKKHKDL